MPPEEEGSERDGEGVDGAAAIFEGASAEEKRSMIDDGVHGEQLRSRITIVIVSLVCLAV